VKVNRTKRDKCISVAEWVSDILVYEGYVDKDAGQLIFDCLAEGLIQADTPDRVLEDIELYIEARADEPFGIDNGFSSGTDTDDGEVH
jgi:hypothetical protein